MDYLQVKNWATFQQYKDRDPKWIKLHRDTLDDYEFDQLSEISQIHLVKIWLLAAKIDNKIPNDEEWIRRKIGAKSKVDIKQLVTSGFLLVYNNVQDCTELYLEAEAEAEAEKSIVPSDKSPGTGIRLPTNRFKTAGEVFEPTVTDYAQWVEIYPGVEVKEQLLKMVGWLDANPTKRKTKAGMKKFINSWLSREQDNAKGRQSKPQKGGEKPSQSARDLRDF